MSFRPRLLEPKSILKIFNYYNSSMLDKIKTKLLEFYHKEDKIWLFFSLFDLQNKLILSNGVLTTDKTLPELIEILYHSLLEKQTNPHILVIDVVKEIQAQPDIQKLITLSAKDYGIFVINRQTNVSGVVLPDTQWIPDIKSALATIKQKYGLSGNVEISTFTTRRIAFEV